MMLPLLLDPLYLPKGFYIFFFSLLAAGALGVLGVLIYVARLKRRRKLSWVEAVVVGTCGSVVVLFFLLKVTNSLLP